MKNTLLILFLIFAAASLISGCASTRTRLSDGHKATPEHIEEHEASVHIHSGFKVYIDGKAADFSIPMYQLRDRFVHVEDGIGDVVHIHKKGITLGYFFETMGVGFNRTCITIPAEGLYCNIYGKKLAFYVNGIENDEFENYEMKDSDRILVSYGGGDIKKQLESTADIAAKQLVG